MPVKAAKPIAILLVDDEVNVTRTLQMILEQQGYSVVPAYSAAQALEKFRDGFRPGIVITDLNMEKDDIGLEVARAAQKLKPKPIVVICTGYANVENASIALEMRIDHLLTKPVNIEELRDSLVKLLRERNLTKSNRRKKGAYANG